MYGEANHFNFHMNEYNLWLVYLLLFTLYVNILHIASIYNYMYNKRYGLLNCTNDYRLVQMKCVRVRVCMCAYVYVYEMEKKIKNYWMRSVSNEVTKKLDLYSDV